MHEWPLVAFTICAQMSVGSFLVLGVIHLLGAGVDSRVMERVSDPALYAIGPLLLAGLAASTLHLGSPVRAANALRHLGGSWLSNEIATGLAFLVLGAAFAFAQWRHLGRARARQALAAVTALVGVFLIYCLVRVYSLRTVPAWDSWYTAMRFATTTLLLGALAVGAALAIAAARPRRTAPSNEVDEAQEEAVTHLLQTCVRGITLAAVAVLALRFVALPLYLAQLSGPGDAAPATTLMLLTNTYGGLSLAHITLVAGGVVVLAGLLAGMRRGSAPARGTLAAVACSAFMMVLAGEVIGRVLFYATMVRAGL